MFTVYFYGLTAGFLDSFSTAVISWIVCIGDGWAGGGGQVRWVVGAGEKLKVDYTFH